MNIYEKNGNILLYIVSKVNGLSEAGGGGGGGYKLFEYTIKLIIIIFFCYINYTQIDQKEKNSKRSIINCNNLECKNVYCIFFVFNSFHISMWDIFSFF